MKQFVRGAAVVAAALVFGVAVAGSTYVTPVITAVYTTYTGVAPTAINITGSGLCATAACNTKPVVKLGGNALQVTGASQTGIGATLPALIGDGDYVLTVTAGSITATYNLTLKSNAASGTQGPAGPQGPVGPAGPQGPQGAKGDAGEPGLAGPPGQQGTKGDTGLTGAMGAAGAKGDKGDKGDTGLAGDGFAFKGAWSDTTAYVTRDVVTGNGSTYVAVAANTGMDPGGDVANSGGNWALLASRGADGAAGADGKDGAPGPQGPQGPAGAEGAQGIQGVQGPPGAAGADGLPGPMGPAGMKGDKGDAGADGAPGSFPSATVAGALLYWNGASWTEVLPPASDGVVLRYCGGVPRWVDVCPTTPPVTPSYVFSENFLDGSFDTSTLEFPSGTFELVADGIRRTLTTEAQSRQYVRTIDAGYLGRNFIFEVKFIVSSVPFDIAFIGFGEAIPDPTYYNEPKNSLTFRIHRGDSGVGRVDVAVHTVGYEAFNYLGLPGNLPAATLPAEYTARIVKTGNTAVFTISGAGGSLTDTITDISGLAPFLNSANTRLFMGNHYSSMSYKSATVTQL